MKPFKSLLAAVGAWLRGAPGWLGGALAGFQAAAFSLAFVLMPTWAVVASAPVPLGARGPDWAGSGALAARLWLLAFGVPLDAGGAVVTLAPLGLTALSALMMVALARRFASKTWTSWFFAVATLAGFVALTAVLVWSGAPDTTARAVKGALAAVLVGAPTAAWGIWRAHGATLAWLGRLSDVLKVGTRLGVGLVATHVVLAATTGAIWMLVGRFRIGDSATALGVDAVGGVSLALVETAFVPTLVVWFMSWTAGTGFDVGLAHYSPSLIVEAPMPAVPLLGGLPTAAGGYLSWVPMALVVSAIVARVLLEPRMPAGWARARTFALAAVIVAVTCGVLGVVASGGIGPGSLARIGLNAAAFAAVSASLSILGLLIGEAGVRLNAMLMPQEPHQVGNKASSSDSNSD